MTALIKHESFQSMNVLGLGKISTLMVRSGRAIGHHKGRGPKLMTNFPYTCLLTTNSFLRVSFHLVCGKKNTIFGQSYFTSTLKYSLNIIKIQTFFLQSSNFIILKSCKIKQSFHSSPHFKTLLSRVKEKLWNPSSDLWNIATGQWANQTCKLGKIIEISLLVLQVSQLGRDPPAAVSRMTISILPTNGWMKTFCIFCFPWHIINIRWRQETEKIRIPDL